MTTPHYIETTLCDYCVQEFWAQLDAHLLKEHPDWFHEDTITDKHFMEWNKLRSHKYHTLPEQPCLIWTLPDNSGRLGTVIKICQHHMLLLTAELVSRNVDYHTLQKELAAVDIWRYQSSQSIVEQK